MTVHRGILVTLVISFAVNLLLLGGAVGIVVANRSQPDLDARPPPPAAQSGIRAFNARRFFQALPQKERRIARRLMRQNAQQHRQLSGQLRASRRELFDLLRAGQMDQVAVHTALKEMRRIEADQAMLGQEIILSLFAKMDAETRKQVIAEMGRPPLRPPNRPPQGRPERRGR